MSVKIECILECENHLGESPIWDVEEGRLYWVDGTGRRVGKKDMWRLDPKSGKVENWSLNRDIGALAIRKDGGAVLALDDGFYFFDFDSGELELITKVDEDQPRSRLNDGKCDRRQPSMRARGHRTRRTHAGKRGSASRAHTPAWQGVGGLAR